MLSLTSSLCVDFDSFRLQTMPSRPVKCAPKVNNDLVALRGKWKDAPAVSVDAEPESEPDSKPEASLQVTNYPQ